MKNQTFAAYRHLKTDAVHILDLAMFQNQTMPDGATSLACEHINEDGEKAFAVIASALHEEDGVTYTALAEKENAEIMDAYIFCEWPQATHGKYENLPNNSEYLFKVDPDLPEHIIATVEIIELESHKKDTWYKVSEKMPPIGEDDWRIKVRQSIRVLCYSKEWGKRFGQHHAVVDFWTIEGVTSSNGVAVEQWMDVSDPMEIIKPAKP